MAKVRQKKTARVNLRIFYWCLFTRGHSSALAINTMWRCHCGSTLALAMARCAGRSAFNLLSGGNNPSQPNFTEIILISIDTLRCPGRRVLSYHYASAFQRMDEIRTFTTLRRKPDEVRRIVRQLRGTRWHKRKKPRRGATCVSARDFFIGSNVRHSDVWACEHLFILASGQPPFRLQISLSARRLCGASGRRQC